MTLNRKNSCLVVVLLLLCAGRADAKGEVWDKYLEQFRKVLLNAHTSYHMSCTYPDSSREEIDGFSAIKEGRYYDSSNVRFVLLNPEWFLYADHREKHISVAYMPAVNKQLEGMGAPLLSSFLFPQDVLGRTDFSIERTQDDTVWVKLHIRDNTAMEKLVVKVRKSTLEPVGYELLLNYPIATSEPDAKGEEHPLCVHVAMQAVIRSYPAPDYLFAHERLIARSGGKATLKRYQHYKTLRP